MIAVLAVTPLVIALWGTAWLAGTCGSRYPKTSWKRLPVALLVIGASLGVPALQIYLLTVLISDKFAHDVFFYIVVAECVPAIALVFYAGIREDKARKRRDLQNPS